MELFARACILASNQAGQCQKDDAERRPTVRGIGRRAAINVASAVVMAVRHSRLPWGLERRLL